MSTSTGTNVAEVKSETADEQELTAKVKELVDFGDEKDIALYNQQQISAEILDGIKESWYKLDEEQAKEVLTNLKLNGHTFWVNRATGQSDITDTEQQEVATLETVTEEVDIDVRSEEGHPTKVFDAETEQWIEVSPQERKETQHLVQLFKQADVFQAFIIENIVSNDRHLHMGCSTEEEFAVNILEISYRHFRRLKRVGERFRPLFPADFANGTSMSLEGKAKEFADLGITKLIELSKIEDADFTEVPTEGRFQLKDGSEIEVEEIKQQSVKEFKRQLDEHRQYIEEQEAELNKAVIAKEKAEKKAKEMEKDSETGLRYKEMFGKKSDQFEAYKNRLLEARSKAADLNQVLSKIEGLPAEFESLVDELRDLHKQIDRGVTRLREDNIESGAFEAVTSN